VEKDRKNNKRPIPGRVTERPAMYEVVLLNDDLTPKEFVLSIVKRFFHKNDIDANDIITITHYEGQGICGLYTRDVAETKMIQVIDFSRSSGYPLKCIIRKYQAYVI